MNHLYNSYWSHETYDRQPTTGKRGGELRGVSPQGALRGGVVRSHGATAVVASLYWPSQRRGAEWPRAENPATRRATFDTSSSWPPGNAIITK